jgi:RimJ/RimL family protein N-acetyltransferase
MTAQEAAQAAAPVVVPIRSLGPSHRARIAAHLKALDPEDRYLRFGYSARDEQIDRYVGQIDFDRDDVLGIYNRKLELIAVAHLAFSDDPEHADCAEFGVSVLKKARGKGFGARLFERAVIHARNEGVDMLFIHALSENRAMLHIAQKAGAKLERSGSETEAHLRLPPATFDTRVAQMLEEQVAKTDYQLKQQARRFWEFLKGLQEVREGVREGRRKSGS